MTMSSLESSSGPGAASPLVIRTRAMRASANTTPTKERLPSPGEAGTKLVNNSSPSTPKYSISELAPRFPFLEPPGWSTSEKTAPNPVVVADMLGLPGTEKSTSVMLLPMALNSRTGLNACKIASYVGLPKVVATPESGACTTRVQGVVKRAPRFRKPVNGVGTTAVAAEPPPSQLISRRPPASGPAALPLLGAPSAARNPSTEL